MRYRHSRFRATAGGRPARSVATSTACGEPGRTLRATEDRLMQLHDSGVADDDEVDRVADLDLISQFFSPVEAGKAVIVAEMAGRARRYDLKMTDGSQHAAVGFALSRRCDLLVAVRAEQGRCGSGRALAPRSRRVSWLGQYGALDHGCVERRLSGACAPSTVMPGLVPGIHVFSWIVLPERRGWPGFPQDPAVTIMSGEYDLIVIILYADLSRLSLPPASRWRCCRSLMVTLVIANGLAAMAPAPR